MNEVAKREMNEAILAGKRALNSLKQAQEKLESARNWGFFDLFGGGLIGTVIKHTRMDEAAGYMEEAKQDLNIFQRELRDISRTLDLNMNIGGFLSFADFFFDGIVADYLVQSKINEAREQVNDAIYHVQELLIELEVQRDEL